jgi:6-phosphogluconolactonase
MTIKFRALLILLVAMATMWTASCGHYNCGLTFGSSNCSGTGVSGVSTGTTSGTPAAFAFYTNQGTIGGALLDTASNFAVIPNFVNPPQILSGIGGIVIVQKQWMYVALTGGLAIQGYSIDGTSGALTALPGSPYGALDTQTISADPAGHFLFLTGANQDEVTVFAINQTDGSLTKVGTFAAGVGFTEQAVTDGLGKYLYVTAGNLGTEVAIFSINQTTGSLTAIPNSPFAISIAQLKGEPTGKFMLGITGNGALNGFASDDNIYVFSINQSGNQTGQITPVAGSPFATTFTPDFLAVHPNGNLVYAFNETAIGTSPMEGFQFDNTTGKLTELSGSPFASFTGANGMFDQSGAYLFMNTLGSLSVANVNTTTGALTSTTTATVPNAGNNHDWAVTDPN